MNEKFSFNFSSFLNRGDKIFLSTENIINCYVGGWKPQLRPMERDFWDSKFDEDDYDWNDADEKMKQKYRNSKLGLCLSILEFRTSFKNCDE